MDLVICFSFKNVWKKANGSSVNCWSEQRVSERVVSCVCSLTVIFKVTRNKRSRVVRKTQSEYRQGFCQSLILLKLWVFFLLFKTLLEDISNNKKNKQEYEDT